MVIHKITADGITFTDESGMERYISFTECNENWLSYRKRTEALSDEKVAEFRGKDRTIGQRDIDSDPAYIEFFSRPFTRFEFSNPAQLSMYYKLREVMDRYGWTTHDLS